MNPSNANQLQHTDTELRRLKLTQQLSADPLKALALLEHMLIAFVLSALGFWLMVKVGLTREFLTGGLIGGMIGGTCITVKMMYRDAALSQLSVARLPSPDALQHALSSLGYTEQQPGVFQPKKRRFSLLYSCLSERITLVTQGNQSHLTGPYDKLKMLSALHTSVPAPTSDHTSPTAPR